MNETITIDRLIVYLNELVSIDAGAISTLFGFRATCNEKLANHPTVQVQTIDNSYAVGIIGLLNGMFGVDADGWGAIAAVWNEGQMIGFRRVSQNDKRG